MKLARSLIFICSFLLVVGCTSKITRFLDITGTDNPNTPDKLEKVVEETFRIFMYEEQTDLRTSLFGSLIPMYSTMTSNPPSKQYKIFVNALFQYMDNLSLSTIVKMKKGTMSLDEQATVIKKIWLAAYETRFLNTYNFPVSISDRTVTLMLRALKHLDPNACKSRGIIVKLAQFCESEACQELVYSSVLASLTSCKNKNLPLMLVNRKIKDTNSYNIFILQCFDIFNDESRKHLVPQDVLVKNIISGPFSVAASDILLIILEEANIREISEHDALIKDLSRFLFETNTFDQFMELLIPELCSSDPKIAAMKSNLSTWYDMQTKISRIVTGSDITTDQNSFLVYMSSIRGNEKVLTEFYTIDPIFVTEHVEKINRDISAFIQQYKATKSDRVKIILLSVSFVLLNCIPKELFPSLIGADYEALLSQYLDPQIVSHRPKLGCELLSRTIRLPFVHITPSTIVKLYQAMQVHRGDAYEQLYIAVAVTLPFRDYDDQIFMESFQACHEGFQQLEFDFSDAAELSIYRLLDNCDHGLAIKLIDYCKKHKLTSKTFLLAAEKQAQNIYSDVGYEFMPVK